MSTTYADTTSSAASRIVVGWRFDELVRAGYDERTAMLVAMTPQIDLHRAVDLVRAGCRPETAVRILF